MKPISMKCSKEQFEQIRPILESSDKRITIDHIHNSFLTYCYLTNDYGGNTGHVSNVGTGSYKDFNREVFEEWDQNKFLECCDIKHIPGKWYHDGEGNVVRFSHYEKTGQKYCDQWIDKDGRFMSTGGLTEIVSYVPVDPSKFSEYLPEGHPDKLPKKVYIPRYVKGVDYSEKFNNKIFDTGVHHNIKPMSWYDILIERGRLEDGSFIEVTKEEFDKQNNTQIPEYVKCVNRFGWGSILKEGVIYDTKVDIPGTKRTWESRLKDYPKDFKPSTKEEFEKQNKEVMSKQKLTVPVTDVLKIHSIACTAWKSKIASGYLPRVNSDQNITFTQEEVNKMFEAVANPKQLTVLEEVFGKQSKPINWCDIKTGSKVMISHTGEHCSGFNNIDNSLPVDVVFFNTLPRINGNGDFFTTESSIPKRKYCTFYQNGKYVLFTNDGEDYKKYITSVVEY